MNLPTRFCVCPVCVSVWVMCVWSTCTVLLASFEISALTSLVFLQVLLRQDDVNDALRVLHNAFVVEEALEAPSEDDFEWLKTTSQVEDMVWSAGTAYQNNAQLAFQSHASVQMATALR